MQSSESTHEEITQYYTTAIDALCEIGREYYTLGRLGDAQHLLRTSLQLLNASKVNLRDHHSRNGSTPAHQATKGDTSPVTVLWKHLEASEVKPEPRLKLLLLYGQVLIVDHLLT